MSGKRLTAAVCYTATKDTKLCVIASDATTTMCNLLHTVVKPILKMLKKLITIYACFPQLWANS